MVELNFDRTPPARAARPHPGRGAARVGRGRGRRLRIGAGVTYTRLIAELGDRLPGPGDRRRARSARRRSATAARSAATSARPRPPATRCRRCSPPTPRSRSRRCAARGGSRWPSSSPAPSATRWPRRADRRVPVAPRRRPAAVREGRHPQRDGDRGLLARAVAVTASGAGRHACIGSAGADADPGAPRPRRSSPACSTGRLWETRGAMPDAAATRVRRARRRGRRARSTTSAAPPPTAATPWRVLGPAHARAGPGTGRSRACA